MEKMIGKLLVLDICENLDPVQYANQQGVSLQHYVIDWKETFPRQCPKLGVEALSSF